METVDDGRGSEQWHQMMPAEGGKEWRIGGQAEKGDRERGVVA